MRIALGGISLLTPLTGIGQYTWQLSQELHKLDLEVELFLGHKWSNLQAFESSSATPDNFRSFTRRALQKVKRYIPISRQNFHQVRQNIFTKAMPKDPRPMLYHEPNFVPWNSDIPTIITIHDLSWIRHPQTHPKDRVNWLEKAIPQALDSAAGIITVSDFVKNEIIEVFGKRYAHKIQRIYNGVNDEFKFIQDKAANSLLEKLHIKPRQYLLAVGTIEPRKNLSVVLQAFSQLPKTIQKQYPLLIAGHRGWLNKDLDSLLKKIPSQSIHFLGYVPQNDLPQLYANAFLMLYPSIYEGFGLPTIEAMASSCPVITSSALALQEVTGTAAIHLDPHDDQLWKSTIMELIENPRMRDAMVQRSLEQSSHFNWRTCGLETLNFYQNTLSKFN